MSPVRLADFDEDSLEGNLDDLAWLSEKATAHDRVLVRALETGAVLPLRFGTIFHDEEQLRRTLRGHQDLLVTALAGLRGRAEWDVKVTCRPAVLADWVSERVERGDSAPTADSAGPGAAFMRQKRMERVLADEADRVRAEVGADVTAVMATHAEEMAAIRSSGDPSSDIEILRRDAYLVPEPNREAFLRASEEVAARYAARGIGIHVSGPLPPYHFASIHLREQADA